LALLAHLPAKAALHLPLVALAILAILANIAALAALVTMARRVTSDLRLQIAMATRSVAIEPVDSIAKAATLGEEAC
jgi:hypothetical protein